MKKPEYVAAVTAMYRKYTDLYMQNGKKGYKVSSEDKRILMDLYNRGGFSAGYYRQHNGQNMIASDRPNHAGVPAVKVESQKGRLIKGKNSYRPACRGCVGYFRKLYYWKESEKRGSFFNGSAETSLYKTGIDNKQSEKRKSYHFDS